MNDSLLALHGISKSFASLPVIQNLNLVLQQGEILSLVGPSGCGKSTLLRIIADAEAIDHGEIHRQVMPDKIGFIFQDVRLLPWRTALENVLFVLKDRIPDHALREERALAALRQVGLADFVHYPPSKLSGGMRKRVAIARALAIDAELLLFDEPFSDLDMPLRMMLLQDIQRLLRRRGKSAIYVTHDVREALLISDRIVVLTARPARVKATISLKYIAHNNDALSPELQTIERRVLSLLAEETRKQISHPPSTAAKAGPRPSLLEMAALSADCMPEAYKWQMMGYFDN